jgi:hypothetical protein
MLIAPIGEGSMRYLSRLLFFTLVVFIITASQTPDFYWGINVGNQISYRYHGIYFDHELVDESLEIIPIPFDEQVYVQIDDLTGVPYPLGNTPSYTPYWANGTPFSETTLSLLSDFLTGNFGMLGPFALMLGNWTYLEEFTLDIVDESFHEIYNNQIGWVNESSTMWNFTLVKYHYWNSSLITPYITVVKQYSKLDGVLEYSSQEANETMNLDLKLTRIPTSPSFDILIPAGIGGAIIVGVLVVLWKRRV